MAEGLIGNEELNLPRQDRGYGQERSDYSRGSERGDRRYRKNPDASHLQGGDVNADLPQSLGIRRTEPRGRGRGGKRRTDLDWRRHDRYGPRDSECTS